MTGRFLIVALIAAVASNAIAQIEVSHKPATILSGLGGSQTLGTVLMAGEDTEIELIGCEIVTVMSEADNITVEASNKDREPILIEQVDPVTWVLKESGKTWVDITAIDFAKNIYAKKSLVINVEGGSFSPSGLEVPEPSDELKSLVSSIRDKLSSDKEKAVRVTSAFMGFADAMRGSVGNRISNVQIFHTVNNAVLKDLEMSTGVLIGADIQQVMSQYANIKTVEGGFENRTLTAADRTKITEVFEAIAWAGT